MKNNKLLLLKQSMMQGDSRLVFNILSPSDFFSEDEITAFLLEEVNEDSVWDLLFSGSGGSGFFKPNFTSISSLFFAAAGYNVFKIGSRRNKGIYGSTDFFENIGIKDLQFTSGYFRYSDVYEAFFWYKYRNLLLINRCFKNFFDTHIINPVISKSKIAFICNEPFPGWYRCRKQSPPPANLYNITSYSRELNLDDAGNGSVYINGKKVYEWDDLQLPIIGKCNIIEINKKLLLGEESSVFSEYLIRNMAIVLSVIRNIPINSAYDCCSGWYKDKIVVNTSIRN